MAEVRHPIEASYIGRDRRAIVRYLMAKHALDTGDAIPMRLATPGVQRAMAALIRRAIVKQPKPGRYCLNVHAWRADAERRRQEGVFITLSAVGMIFVGLMLLYPR